MEDKPKRTHNPQKQYIDFTLDELKDFRRKAMEAFKIITGKEFVIRNSKNTFYYKTLSEGILDVTKGMFHPQGISISLGTLYKFFKEDIDRTYQFKTIEGIEKYIEEAKKLITPGNEVKNTDLKKLLKTIALDNWSASANFSTPQWANYVKLPIDRGLIKRIRCQIITTSEYYRFGFKLVTKIGKLFGDGSIQSMDNNFVIHYGKNFLSNDLFITTYRNGIRQRTDKYVDAKPSNGQVLCELFIDDENIMYLFLNGMEVFKFFINKEIREQVFMLAWADGNEFQMGVENIEIEIETE